MTSNKLLSIIQTGIAKFHSFFACSKVSSPLHRAINESILLAKNAKRAPNWKSQTHHIFVS
jgi:hypothetical protein